MLYRYKIYFQTLFINSKLRNEYKMFSFYYSTCLISTFTVKNVTLPSYSIHHHNKYCVCVKKISKLLIDIFSKG